MRAAKVQASLRIRAVSPESPLLTHTSSESRRTFKQKARSLDPLNSWACTVKICHDGMLENANSLDTSHIEDGCADYTVQVLAEAGVYIKLLCTRCLAKVHHSALFDFIIQCIDILLNNVQGDSQLITCNC